ncbi:hypothetical protein Cme02nite_06700 [Catellatospora methionotrophica]|uniref:Uncharacterized protein n=1 Tax=Catellatospora methionotrophica TaxID=121620 RepID=A0A8J3L0W3_9ACTN|nr:hypothetical protein Cme02nite_06700 [Catellatospora methionotrophica]
MFGGVAWAGVAVRVSDMARTAAVAAIAFRTRDIRGSPDCPPPRPDGGFRLGSRRRQMDHLKCVAGRSRPEPYDGMNFL